MKFALFIMTILTLASCTISPPELKSPCVANDKGVSVDGVNPCVRRPVNSWLA